MEDDCAADLRSRSYTEEDQAPTMLPLSAGRRGPRPLLIKLPSLKEEAAYLADRLKAANKEANRTGMPWNDMAVLYRHYAIGKEVAETLARMGVPYQCQQDKKHKFDPMHDSVKLINPAQPQGAGVSSGVHAGDRRVGRRGTGQMQRLGERP